MKRTLPLFLLGLFLALFASAQTATVKRNVVLRKKPSAKSERITSLKPPTKVTLIAPKQKAGFLHVKTQEGQKGWAFANYLEVGDQGDAEEHTSDTDIVQKLLAVRTDAVGKPLIEGGQDVCGPTGNAKDNARKNLNQNKNRTDIPDESAYVPIDWTALRNLPEDRATDLDGAPVVVEGFLVHRVKVENEGKGESTNCNLLGDNEVDWHMYLSDTAGLDDISQAVIVETTPRTRPLHHWAKADLDNVVNKTTRVRISGWLLYDFEHISGIGSQRATVWEVHPITKIEVKRNGQWFDLDRVQ